MRVPSAIATGKTGGSDEISAELDTQSRTGEGDQSLFAALGTLAHSLAEVEDQQEVYRSLHHFLLTTISCDSLSIALFDAGGRRNCVYTTLDGLEIAPTELAQNTQAQNNYLRLPGGLWIPSSGAVVVEHEPDKVESSPEASDELTFSLLLPMMVPGRALGQIEIRNRKQYDPDAEHESALHMAAGLVSMALENVRLKASARAAQSRFQTLKEELEHQAFHDPLTRLPNRTLFHERLAQALRHAERRHDSTAVLFLDLDRFKVINDSLGHASGDELLTEVARRLQSCIRPGDTAARLGGDEFTVLLEHVGTARDAITVAERILERLQAPFALGAQEVFITASIGIAVAQASEATSDDLMRYADIAMYRAKTSGRGHYEVFDQNMTNEALERLQLETDMRHAVERGEFRVYYQPKVLLETGRIVGMEALVRWQHPLYGLVSPGSFIPLAEETGLILPIGQWVLRQATRQAKVWQETYPNARALAIAVNLSARQFQQKNLVVDIAKALQESGLLPGRLNLELTESMLMEDALGTMNTLNQLKQLGVQLSIDDFGTGYSSLSYLKRFPVDMLKIGQSFIEGLGEDRGDSAIVRAVITLARTLGMIVTAEGVETAQQLAHLRALGCDLGQGYFFAPPVDATKAGELLSGDLGQFGVN